MTSSLFLFSMTSLASPLATWPNACVHGVIEMSSRAMGSLRVMGGDRFASQEVDSPGNRFKVLGISAGSSATKVIEIKIARHWANEQFVDQSVNSKSLPPSPSHIDAAITIPEDSPAPKPTGTEFGAELWNRPILVDARPQPHFQRRGHPGTQSRFVFGSSCVNTPWHGPIIAQEMPA